MKQQQHHVFTKVFLALLGTAAVLIAAAFLIRFEYAPLPDESDLLNPKRHLADVAHYVDAAAGYSREQQDALIAFLLSMTDVAQAP